MKIILSPKEIETLKARFYNAVLTDIFEPTHNLWVFRVKPDKGMLAYKPGQYTTLGLGIWETCVAENGPETLKPGQEKQLLRRAYSVSHPILNSKSSKLYSKNEIDFYEFYVALVVNNSGKPTPPRLTPRLFALKKGDRLSLGPKMTGHYNLSSVGPKDQVFFFATGTGEAPHNAMIWELLSKGHPGPIVSTVCTRFKVDQAYRSTHETLEKQFPNYKVIYLATREPNETKMYCQDLIQSGAFQSKTGLQLDPSKTHVYLCGNPSMIGRPEIEGETKKYPTPVGIIEILEKMGFTVATPTQPGNIHFEAYW